MKGGKRVGRIGDIYFLLKRQIKAITPFFVTVTRNRTVNIHSYVIEITQKSCSSAENKPLK